LDKKSGYKIDKMKKLRKSQKLGLDEPTRMLHKAITKTLYFQLTRNQRSMNLTTEHWFYRIGQPEPIEFAAVFGKWQTTSPIPIPVRGTNILSSSSSSHKMQ
jgi:hypothetical protein